VLIHNLYFVFPIQRSSFATASDDRWQSQVLQMGNFYQMLDLSGVFQPDSVGEGNKMLFSYNSLLYFCNILIMNILFVYSCIILSNDNR